MISMSLTCVVALEPFFRALFICSRTQPIRFFSIFGNVFPFLVDGAISSGNLPTNCSLKCVLSLFFRLKAILEDIGNENILLQLGGYESYVNVLNKINVNRQIRERNAS